MPVRASALRCVGSIWGNRAKISIEEPGVASCRQLMDNGMASVSQLNPYQCDQCGTANIVAAPVLYQQGTHTYSTRFHSGTTQSFSAQAVAPPRPRGFLRPFLLWGPAIALFSLWGPSSGSAQFSIIHRMLQALGRAVHSVFLVLGVHSLQAWFSVFAKSRATTVKFILVCIGTGSTPIYAGVVDGPA